MTTRDGQYPPRASSRFAPGIYFNFEWGVSLSSDKPTQVRGVNFTSRRMQERFHNDEQERRRQMLNNQARAQRSTSPQRHFLHPNQHIDTQTRDFQHERQRRLGVRHLEQHQRGSSAPPSLDRDEIVSPLSPDTIQPIQQTSSFPRERLDRPLPYSPSRFRLGEDNLPWSVPPWYRSPEPEFASPLVDRPPPLQIQQQQQSPPRRGQASPSRRSVSSKASMSSGGGVSMVGPLPSLGFESTGRRQRGSPRRRESARPEDPQRVHDLGELHSAMIGVQGLHNEGLESSAWDDGVSDTPAGGPRSLGWAVRTEPDLRYGSDFIGFYGPGLLPNRSTDFLLSPPPTYVDSQWEEFGRRTSGRPRSSG